MGFKRKSRGMVGLLIPGQGFQSLGMGRAENGDALLLEEIIGEAKKVVSPIFIERVRYLMFADPSAMPAYEKEMLEQELNKADNAQVALFLHAAALWKKYYSSGDNLIPSVVMGHSAGEPIAGYIAGSLDFADCLRYVFTRGRLMDTANNLFKGGMIAIAPPKMEDGFNIRKLEKCLKGTKTEIANINTPRQIAISGSIEELGWVSVRLREKGFRVIPLERIAGAYHHSGAMVLVENGLDQMLNSPFYKITIKKPAIKWIFNFSGAEEDDVKKIKVYLLSQMSNTVRWREGIEKALSMGVSEFVELGRGGLLKMLDDFPAWKKVKERTAANKSAREAII